MLKAFFIALGLFTRIPVPKIFYITQKDNEKLYGWSVLFYPLVGLMIGGVLVFVSWGLSFLALTSNELLVGAIILSVWVLITGALHLDGLADSADAWLGGYGDQQRTLEIMKDPCSGPAAVVILILVLLLKFSVLINVNWQILLLTPVLARTAAMILLTTTSYVRSGGMGESAANNVPSIIMWCVVLLVIVLTITLIGTLSLGLIIIFIIGYLLRAMMKVRIGGVTGDTAGALIEIIEVASLIVFVLLSHLLSL
ncbi:MAG: adenosylcobinamide-GDP ribazoletransferase [Woeseiaceae bacterium]